MTRSSPSSGLCRQVTARTFLLQRLNNGCMNQNRTCSTLVEKGYLGLSLWVCRSGSLCLSLWNAHIFLYLNFTTILLSFSLTLLFRFSSSFPSLYLSAVSMAIDMQDKMSSFLELPLLTKLQLHYGKPRWSNRTQVRSPNPEVTLLGK